MFPGHKVQSCPEDPHFSAPTEQLTPPFQRKEPPSHACEELPTCPSQAHAGNHIGETPTPLLFHNSKPAPISTNARSSQPPTRSVRNNACNPGVPCTQGWPGAIAPKNLFEDDKMTTPSVAQMPLQSCRASRGEADSSDEESNSHNQQAHRKKESPYLLPAAGGMCAGWIGTC
jgi:hypothetical protein